MEGNEAQLPTKPQQEADTPHSRSNNSWLPVTKGHPFSIANIPFGIITTDSNPNRRCAVAIGLWVLDLSVFATLGGFRGLQSVHLPDGIFAKPALNDFAALGRPVHRQVRRYLQEVFREDTWFPTLLKDSTDVQNKCLMLKTYVKMHLPMQIGDYTDFYAGLNHAFNVGALIRDPDNALPPNYKHMPIGYHGRASSVVLSGTPICRPWGQILDSAGDSVKPIFSPCRKLDYELELGAFVCKPNKMGEPIPVDEAENHLFGFVLMNDWSARDIQTWEYRPLGPFNAKNFATTISAWVVLADALESFRVPSLKNETELLPYLREDRTDNVYDIDLRVGICPTPDISGTHIIGNVNSRNLLFSFSQMLAHHTITGCPVQVGDLLGSGTISGDDFGSMGSMLEQCRNGDTPVDLGGHQRLFVEDGDVVVMEGQATNSAGDVVGFGQCVGKILPAIAMPAKGKS